MEQGLLTRSTLLQTRQQHEQTREKIRSARSQLAQLDVQKLSSDNERTRQLSAGLRDIDLARLELDTDGARPPPCLAGGLPLHRPHPGSDDRAGKDGRAAVSRCSTWTSTGSSVKNLVAVVYVPSVHGKKVKPGMDIHIAPSTVRQEEYGMMLGKVTFVSNFPATPRGMAMALKNDQLVQSLSGNGAPYEVHADLVVDPATPSRYRWSSSKGPPVDIQSGTLASGQVTVDRQRPVAAVLPLLRRWSGM